MGKTRGSDPHVLGSSPSTPAKIYTFWDEVWQERLGIIALEKFPEPGTVIEYGFIRYKPTTKWLVTGENLDGEILAKLCL